MRKRENEGGDTYQPLVVIFAVIFIASIALELADSTWQWMTFGQYFMGLFFTFFAMFKLFDLSGFKHAFQMYDLVAQKFPIYAAVYPFIELFLGLMYLSDTMIFLTNVLTVVIMCVGLVGILKSLLNDKGFQCACVGTVIHLPLSMISGLENVLMALMSLAMIYNTIF